MAGEASNYNSRENGLGSMRILALVRNQWEWFLLRPIVARLADTRHTVVVAGPRRAREEVVPPRTQWLPLDPLDWGQSRVRDAIQPDIVTGIVHPRTLETAARFDARRVLFADGSIPRERGWFGPDSEKVFSTSGAVDAGRPQGGGSTAFEVHVPAWERRRHCSARTNVVYYDGHPILGPLLPERFDPRHTDLKVFGVEPEERQFLLQRTPGDGGDSDTTWSESSYERVRRTLESAGVTYELDTIERVFSIPGLPVPPELIAPFLATTDLVVCDSRGLAGLAATLGRPTCYLGSPDKESLLAELHRYGLLEVTDSLDGRVVELVSNPASIGVWRERRRVFFETKQDVVEHAVESLVGRTETEGASTQPTEEYVPHD